MRPEEIPSRSRSTGVQQGRRKIAERGRNRFRKGFCRNRSRPRQRKQKSRNTSAVELEPKARGRQCDTFRAKDKGRIKQDKKFEAQIGRKGFDFDEKVDKQGRESR